MIGNFGNNSGIEGPGIDKQEEAVPEDVVESSPDKDVAESTPEESEVISRFLDAKAKVYDINMSAEERKETASMVMDLMRVIEGGKGLRADFTESIKLQVKGLDNDFVSIGKIREAMRELRRASSGGADAPTEYEKAVKTLQDANDKGLPDMICRLFEDELKEYLLAVKGKSGK